MSLVQKHMEYIKQNGADPSPKESLVIAHEILDEFMQKLAIAVIPERDDNAILTAAYKLMYESRYNALEPYEKNLCDNLVKTSVVISKERILKRGEKP